MAKEFVLITGATGFIGSHVAEYVLREKSYGLVAIVRQLKNYKNVEQLKKKGVILIKGAFYDKGLIQDIFSKYLIKKVIHVGALRGSGAGSKNEYNKVNVDSTEILLGESLKHQVDKFIYCSSVGVFGTIPKSLPATISTEFNGDNAYHLSKIKAEEKVVEYIKKGLNAYIVRPSITYGKGDDGFPSTLIKLIRKRMLLLPVKDNLIHLISVEKLAELFVKIIIDETIKNRIIIAGDRHPITLIELTNLIYNYYYRKENYPVFLRIPRIVSDALVFFFETINNSKWKVRIQLLCYDWHYDTTEMKLISKFVPAETHKDFLNYLQTLEN